MAKHAYAAYGIRIAKLRHPDDFRSVDNIDGAGLGIEKLVHGFLQDVHAEQIVESFYQNYFSVENIFPAGRAIAFAADFGRYGVEGSIKDVMTNERTHQYGDNESAVINVRNLLVVPVRGEMALLLAERYGGRGVASIFLRTLKKAFGRHFAEERLRINSEALINTTAWREFLKTAEMTQIKAVKYNTESDIAADSMAKSVGSYVYSMKPVRGRRKFDRSLRDLIIHEDISVQQLMGLRDDLEIDETRVDLSNGSQQREWIINRGELPVLAYPLRDDDEDERPGDEEVYSAMAETANQLAQEYNLTLPYGWRRGSWDDDSLSVKMGAIRDN